MRAVEKAGNKIVVGIAGGIGAGKSVVTDDLRSLGYTVIDADEVAREAVIPGAPALAALVREFGTGILRPDGTLDRAALAALAFSADDSTAKLNDILHADITVRIKKAIQEFSQNDFARNGEHLCFLSAPLLFESGLDALCDTVWLITAPEDIRIARAAARDMASEEDIRARAAKQMGEDERRAKADLIIDNSKTPEDLLNAVRHALETLQKPARPVHHR
jgi:dephospho-CoA kinase